MKSVTKLQYTNQSTLLSLVLPNPLYRLEKSTPKLGDISNNLLKAQETYSKIKKLPNYSNYYI